MNQPNRSRSYGIIPVYHDSRRWRYLLVQRKRGWWEFPKGRPEAGEVPQATAVRELAEETGIRHVKLVDHVSFETTIRFPSPAGTVQRQIVLFLGKVVSPKFVLQPQEIVDAHWFDARTARLVLTFPAYRNILYQVHHYLHRP